MAHFAEIDDNNIVLRVLVVPDEQERRGHEYLANDCQLGGTWLQTSYNTLANQHSGGGSPLRGNYAAIGDFYDSELDAFIPPQPFPSWVLNETTCVWDAPVAYPDDGLMYNWDEASQSWQEVTDGL